MAKITKAYLMQKMIKKLGILSSLKIVYWRAVLRKLKSHKGTYTDSIYIRKVKQRVYIRPFEADFNLLLDFFVIETEQGGEHYEIKRVTDDKDVKYIVDAGANIGLFSVLYGNKYPDAKIVAIEPDENNYNLLVKNTQKNRNCISVRGGIWYKEAMLNIDNPLDDSISFRVDEAVDGKGNIKAYSIDDLMRRYSFPRIDVFKMDIEGAEWHLFHKGEYENWITKTKYFICELHENLCGGGIGAGYQCV